jgi:phosphoglycolate phosphatase-like HAD superfamily hydrolase
MKALFLDADGTLWYVGDENADGYQQPSDRLCIDPNLKKLTSELSIRRVPVWIVSYNVPGTVERAVKYLKLTDQIPSDRISCNWRDKGERIREIMSTNGIEKGLFIGDRVSDYQASLAAKIEGRIIKRRFNARYWSVGPTISSLLDILPLLDAL